MQRWMWAATLGVALVTSSAARAHELVCEKTVNGESSVTVENYPVTLMYRVTVTNVHPADASILEAISDTMHTFDIELPMTLGLNQSVTFDYLLTINSFEECARIAGQSEKDVVSLQNVVEVVWDLGSAQCTAEVICKEDEGEQPPGGATRTMGFFKTHEDALSACLDEGAINLGFMSVSTLEAALGILWGSPNEFADGSDRSELDKFRFLLARQTLVATCNVRLFGADDGGLVAMAVAALSGQDCTLIGTLAEEVDDFNNSNDDVPFPSGFDQGPATPRHAKMIASDPTMPSGLSCE